MKIKDIICYCSSKCLHFFNPLLKKASDLRTSNQEKVLAETHKRDHQCMESPTPGTNPVLNITDAQPEPVPFEKETDLTQMVYEKTMCIDQYCEEGQNDTQDQPDDSVSSFRGQDLLAVLKALGEHAGPSENTLDSARMQDCLAYASGLHIMDTLFPLQGEELMTALKGVEYLGRSQDPKGEYGLSGLSCAVIIQFFARYCPENVVRRGIAMYAHMLPQGTRVIEPLSSLVGCSKKRTYAGVGEFKEFGFLVDAEHPNTKGAGRTPVEEEFRQLITPSCLVAGRTREELLVKGSQTEYDTNAEAVKKEYLDKNAPPEEEAPVQKSGDGEYSIILPGKADLVALCQKVKESSAPVLERLEYEYSRAKTGDVVELGLFLRTYRCAIDAVEGHCNRIPSDTDHGATEKTGGDVADSRTGEQSRHQDVPDLFGTIYPLYIVNITRVLQEACDTLATVFQKYGEESDPYTVVKEIMRHSSITGLGRRLERQWEYLGKMEKSVQVFEKLKEEGEAFPSPAPEGASAEEQIPVPWKEALQELDSLTDRLDSELGMMEEGSKEAGKVCSALDELHIIRGFLMDTFEKLSTDSEARYAQGVMAETVLVYSKICGELWDGSKTSRAGAKKAAAWILSSKMKELIVIGHEDYEKACTADNGSASEEKTLTPKAADEEGPTTKREQEPPVQKEAVPEAKREECRRLVQGVTERLASLKGLLEEGQEKKREKTKDDGTIGKALGMLDEIPETLEVLLNTASKVDSIHAWDALLAVARALWEHIQKWWDKAGGGEDAPSPLSYSAARTLAQSIGGKRNEKRIADLWAEFEKRSQRSDTLAGGSIPSHYREYTYEEDWFTSTSHISPKRRCEIINRLWSEGKDPTCIRTWIEYIMDTEYSRTYGDPCGHGTCCRITREELQNAFRYFTGITYSGTTLWNILVHEMGYTGHQCEKIDQIGEAHPEKELQYQHIKSMVQKVDREKTLVVSIDTKAMIQLGRFKHDDSRLMKAPDASTYAVVDHDFILQMKDIYPNGTSLIDDDRMEEKAVLHPVGAYCPNDNTGYIALVLGKDTAESMANLLITVIEKKRADMPKLESVLILADGGGSNIANGVTWTNELLRVRDETHLRLDVCHYSPGASKHNPVEHSLFGPISKHWRGRPFLDIEHVAHYIVTTTEMSEKGKNLTVKCWFDKKRYKTNAEKKAAGEAVLTRAQLEEMAGDDIVHPFEKGTGLYKWNYSILNQKVEQEEESKIA